MYSKKKKKHTRGSRRVKSRAPVVAAAVAGGDGSCSVVAVSTAEENIPKARDVLSRACSCCRCRCCGGGVTIAAAAAAVVTDDGGDGDGISVDRSSFLL